MIKDVFKLRKNAWHTKLMKWVWNYDYHEFPTMCTYFWITILNVIGLPIILVLKAFIQIGLQINVFFEWTSDQYEKACNTKAGEWFERQVDKLLTDEHLQEIMYKAHMNQLHWNKRNNKYYKLLDKMTDDERDSLFNKVSDRLKARMVINDAKAAEIRQKQKKREDYKRVKIGKLTVAIKMIVKIVKWPVLLGALYLLYLFGSFMTTLNYSWVPELLTVTGITLILLLQIFLLVYFIYSLVEWARCLSQEFCDSCSIRMRKILKVLTFMLYPFKRIVMFFKWIGRVFKSLWEVIKAIKADNCPAIDWVDES